MLISVADQLRHAVDGTGFVCRLGGDEFLIVQAGVTDMAEVEGLCRRLLQTFAQRRRLDSQMFSVTMSIGVAMAGVDGTSTDDLLRHADMALYSAKAGGRNSFCFFSAAMNASLTERREMEEDMRNAFERGEFELHYQPLVDVGSGRMVGVETLMRWNHAVKGWIPPATFIPIAEASGMIIPMGRWLIETACRQAVLWPDVILAVNMSPAQFRDRTLVAFIAETLVTSGLKPARLEIEITEGLFLDEKDRPLEILMSLKALGVRIAMDDFGTGYSSLGYLQSFPFDKIKIDRSFISKLETDPNARAIIKSVVSLGQNLGMATTAEGVETMDQLAFLQREGCDQVQGYYLARPQSPLALTSLMAAWPLHSSESTVKAYTFGAV